MFVSYNIIELEENNSLIHRRLFADPCNGKGTNPGECTECSHVGRWLGYLCGFTC